MTKCANQSLTRCVISAWRLPRILRLPLLLSRGYWEPVEIWLCKSNTYNNRNSRDRDGNSFSALTVPIVFSFHEISNVSRISSMSGLSSSMSQSSYDWDKVVHVAIVLSINIFFSTAGVVKDIAALNAIATSRRHNICTDL